MGAHLDPKVSDLIEFAENRNFFGFEVVINHAGKEYAIFELADQFPHHNTVADAAIRQIAAELLLTISETTAVELI